MEQELKGKAKKELLFMCSLIILVIIIVITGVFVGIWGLTRTFNFMTMLGILAFSIIISMILAIKKLKFINESYFTYGKVIKVETNNPEDSDVYQDFVIVYIEETTNKICEIKREEHFGDYRDELKREIEDFYKEGEKLLERKIPLLYKINEPNKTIVFLEKSV